jgi:hypothetical protein
MLLLTVCLRRSFVVERVGLGLWRRVVVVEDTYFLVLVESEM